MRKTVFALALGLLLGSAGTAVAANTDAVQAVYAKFNIVINGKAKQLSTDPLVVNGTSYLPVRAMADLFGFELDYDDATRTISMQTPVPGDKIKEKGTGDTVSMGNEEWISVRDLAKNYGVEVSANSLSLTLSKDGKTVEIKFVLDGDEIVGGETSAGTVGLRINNSTTELKLSDLQTAGLID